MIENNAKYSESDNQKVLSRYKRAEALEHESLTDSMVLNAQIYPNWIVDSHCFWYIRKFKRASRSVSRVVKEYRIVNAKSATNDLAFEHAQLAHTLAKSVGRDIDPENLPITDLDIDLTKACISFKAFDKHWRFDQKKKNCEEVTPPPAFWLVSPDGKKAVFVREYNLWIHDLQNGEERALTQDGERDFAYGALPERMNLVAGLEIQRSEEIMPEALWSPDSKKIVTVQTDERKVLTLPVTQYVPADGSVRPYSAETKYALPGDEQLPEFRFLSIDVESAMICRVNYPSVLDSVIWLGPFSGNRAWWSNDGKKAYFIDMSRGQKRASVVGFNTVTGEADVLFEEVSDTYIDLNLNFEEPASLVVLPDTNELIWYSERGGWAHLYLYDLDRGELKNIITSGDWLVREVLHLDVKRREVILQISGRIAGRDPYYREVCRVHIDTAEMVILASSDHDHIVYKPMTMAVLGAIHFGKATRRTSGISPDGEYFVVTRSRADEASKTELRDRNGGLVLAVEEADISGLPDTWQWPEPVKLVGADGKTGIYGLVFRPSDFSPDKSYPVIDWAMNNPFYAFVPKESFDADHKYMPAAALAELGFIVVTIDGRGSCYRSKAFHDEAYGRITAGSDLEDHIAGIRQLAERYPYMDLNRVGITDASGCTGPVLGMLAFPDFYKVGTVTSIWDVRLLTQGEVYQGLPSDSDYEVSVLGNLANNLQGKLMIIHGMMDPFFHLSGVFQLVDALISANKDFDLVLLPRGGHTAQSSRYGVRRSWDYLVKNLRCEEPPVGFQLTNGVEFALDVAEEKYCEKTVG